MNAPFKFQLPDELCATAPPEVRGIARDHVRMMVINRKSHSVEHGIFSDISNYLNAGDLLVFNSSRTLPARLLGVGVDNGPSLEVRLAEHLPDDSWLALLVCQNSEPEEPFSCGIHEGLELSFGHELTAKVGARDERIPRLWRVTFSQVGAQLLDTLYRVGSPIRYEYVSAPWALDYYQNVYAGQPGSAEMPSAGRAFSWKLLFDLKRRGIDSTNILLHTGLSSYLDSELDAAHPMSEEEYFISEQASNKINQARLQGKRIIAVGTTVVRTLETVANADGIIQPGHGYTRIHITRDHNLKAVDSLITGLHEPEASHLDLLTAFLPASLIDSAYSEAIARKYLWHEFGDINLIL